MWRKPTVTAGVEYREPVAPKQPSVVVIEWDDRIYRVPIGDLFHLTIHLGGSWHGDLSTGIKIVGVE